MDTRTLPPLTVLPRARQVLAGDQPVSLGDRALDLLLALCAHPDRVVSKDELLDAVWPGLAVEEANLHVQVSALRRALGAQAVLTVHGRGYRLGVGVAVMAHPPGAGPAVTAQGRQPVGQQAGLAQWRAVAASARLVTMVGPAGVGKTCLARACVPDAPWVDLSALTDPALLLPALARSLACPGPADGAGNLDDWVDALRDTAPLAQGGWLVLDNAEHLQAAVKTVAAALLDAVPSVRLLVTSRQALGLRAEHLLTLAPLTVPDSHQSSGAAQADAVRLFADRAQAGDHRFVLDAGTLPGVVAVCRLLDGLPLALELAAARLPMLGLQGLLGSLRQGLQPLANPGAPAQARHRSLSALLDAGWALLPAPAQRCLCRLSVLCGPFGLDQALAVAQDDDDPWPAIDALELLRQQHLVVPAAPAAANNGPPQWRLLQTTRHWARQRLGRGAHAQATLARHAACQADFFEALEEEWVNGQGTEADIDHRAAARMNALVAALQWACGPEGDAALGARLLRHGGRSLYLHGLRGRATEWADWLHQQAQPLWPAAQQVDLWLSAVWVRPRAWADNQPLLQALRQAHAQLGAATPAPQRLHLCCVAALAAARAGDTTLAAHWLAQAPAAPGSAAAPRLRALRLYTQLTLHQFVAAAPAPDPAQVLDVLQDLDASADGHCRHGLLLRITLGEWQLVQGQATMARAHLQAVCDSARQRGEAGPLLAPHDTLAAADLACGDPAAAARSLGLALQAARRADLWAELGGTWAWYLASQCRWRAAALLLGATRAHRAARRLHLDPVQAVSDAAALALCQAGCATGELDRWLSEGQLHADPRQMLWAPQPLFLL